MNKTMKRSTFYTIVIFIILNTATFSQIYVAPDGNDSTNAGTIDQPFESIQKAQELASPGDTVFIRGGTYKFVRIKFQEWYQIFLPA